MAALSWNRLNRKRVNDSLEEKMNLLTLLQSSLYRLAKDVRGQDLIEYALMAGFVAVIAGAIMPGVASSISTIFSQIAGVMANAASQG
jgi:pilus assembly protein Flp/PilA